MYQMRRVFFLLLLVSMGTACTYHGQIRRGLYTRPAYRDRTDASILVVADRQIPAQILITDPDNADTQAFVLDTVDGVAVAVTDALGTLFTRADAGSATLQEHYDFVADVTLESGLTRTNCTGELSQWAVRQAGLCTLLTVTIRKAGETTPLATATSSHWREFRTPGLASSVRWLDTHTRIFFFILTPLYVQSQGHALRKQFEDNLTDTLDDIVNQLKPSIAALPNN